MRNAKQRRTEREVSSLEENVVQPSEVEAQEVETEPNVELQPSVEEQQISQELEVETESGGEESIAAGTSVVTDTSMIHSESEPEGELDPQDVFDEWMLGLKTVDRKMLATCLFMSFQKRQKMSVMDAAQEAASITGFNERTVRAYAKEFNDNNCSFKETRQGKYERMCILNDEGLRERASEFVRANAFKKGEPNMTSVSFLKFVNNELLPSHHLSPHFPRMISLRTAIRWLHNLGFKPVSHKKGIYIDGHEREDVVKHRDEYLTTLHTLQQTHQSPPPIDDDDPSTSLELSPFSANRPSTSASASAPTDKKLVMIYHDESIFNTNEGQTWMWGTDNNPAILPKTKGSGIMVSDFVEEHGGYLHLSEDELDAAAEIDPEFPYEARQLLEYGAEREGYWTSEKFMLQMKKAVQIAEFKYNPSTHTIIWLFDQSSCHKAYAPDALNANKMNVNPGGVQPLMRDTVWVGRVQRMVFNVGNVAKGMRKVLEERGINTTTLRADDMRKILSNHDDFRNEKTLLERFLIDRGHKVIMIPKFHCELNPIERVWGQAKRYSRAYTNFTLPGLRRILPQALDSVSVTSIRKYFRKARDYEKAYSEGHAAGKEVENAVKRYKSHRRVFHED